MALTMSRVDRTPRTYDLASILGDVGSVPADATSVQVALLPPRGNPTAATVWTSVPYASGSFSVLWVGPDADSAGATLVVPASADVWGLATDAPLVQAFKIERITLLGGGGTLPGPPPSDASVAALLNDTQSATYAKVVALIADRAGFGGTATP